ncbi:hypothetical protein HW509_12995 [Asaia spathodeae]|uniref:hypothetical protein n=1 Tax=Asaia spathodeae TaxID=657016 RepID=UPI002FC275BB
MAIRHNLFLTLWLNAIDKWLIVQKSDGLQGAAGRLKLIITRRREAQGTGEGVLIHALFLLCPASSALSANEEGCFLDVR